jgi:inner membrane protein
MTQALLGASIAGGGFRARLGGRAVLFGAICGVLPDLDVVAGLSGEWASLVHHRGISHSLIALPPASLPIGALAWRFFGSRQHLSAWIHLAFWALITHPLLDLFTAYGTQLFAPISDRRYALDGVAIIDPIYTIPLAAAVLKRNRRWAVGALMITTLYLVSGVLIGAIAERSAKAELTSRGFEPAAMRALVPIGFPLLRRIAARDEGGDLRIGVWSPFRDHGAFIALEQNEHPRIEAALASLEGRIFRWFADGYVYAVVEGDTVELWDERYGLFVRSERGLFRARMTFDASGTLVSATMRPRPDLDFRAELAAGWRALCSD